MSKNITGVLLAFLTFLIQGQAFANEKVAYQNWVVDIGGVTTEAYTANDANSSFGLFCTGDKCLFYLHQPLRCQPNQKYSVLMNSAAISTALTMQCTQVGGNLFEILDPFAAVFKATQSGGMIGFAVALQSGAFAVTTFNLAGASDAIKRTIAEAGRVNKPAPSPPKIPPNSPGIRGLKDISI